MSLLVSIFLQYLISIVLFRETDYHIIDGQERWNTALQQLNTGLLNIDRICVKCYTFYIHFVRRLKEMTIDDLQKIPVLEALDESDCACGFTCSVTCSVTITS